MSDAPTTKRIEVGVPGFDELVHGGLPAGRSTLLAGSTGSGKTVFGLQFLVDGARRGEHGVLVSFAERPEDLISLSALLDVDISPHLIA